MPEIYEPIEGQEPTLWTGGRLEDRLRRVIEVASQPMGGPTPTKPLPFSEAPVEWLASLAAYTVALPFKAIAGGLKEMEKGRLGAGLLRGGPRGETGEWTPEQYGEAITNLSASSQALMGGMPGGAVGPTAVGIGRRPAMRMMAKGVRDFLKPYKSTMRKKMIERVGPTYRELMKGLKHVPEEVLEPLTAIETVTGSMKLKKMGAASGLHKASEQRVLLDPTMPPEEAINVLFHEVTHAEQFRPHREFVEALGSVEKRWPRIQSLHKLGLEVPEPFMSTTKPRLEAHAYEAGDIFESAVRHLETYGKKMDLPTFKKIYEQAGKTAEFKFGKKPGLASMEKIRTESFARRKKRRGLWGEQEKALGVHRAISLEKPGSVMETPLGKIKVDKAQTWAEGGPTWYQYTFEGGPAKGATFMTKEKGFQGMMKKAKVTLKNWQKEGGLEGPLRADLPEGVTPITHRQLPVKGVTDPFSDAPLDYLRIKSYPAGYQQMQVTELPVTRISKKARIEGERIIPPGTTTHKRETIRDILPPYWIEGKDKAGKWIEISRYGDLKKAEVALKEFSGGRRFK